MFLLLCPFFEIFYTAMNYIAANFQTNAANFQTVFRQYAGSRFSIHVSTTSRPKIVMFRLSRPNKTKVRLSSTQFRCVSIVPTKFRYASIFLIALAGISKSLIVYPLGYVLTFSTKNVYVSTVSTDKKFSKLIDPSQICCKRHH